MMTRGRQFTANYIRSPEHLRHEVAMMDSSDARYERAAARIRASVGVDSSRTLPASNEPTRGALQPLDPAAPGDPLRPSSLREMVGQDELKPVLRRLIDNGRTTHLLFVGASGTGKTTISTVIARELGTRIFALKAPIGMDVLDELRQVARDGDVVFVDEIHMQVTGDRRGITQACDPESFYMLLEDGVLSTSRGPLKFPKVIWIGATTDVGLLPEPLINRFPIRPQLAPYSELDMAELALRSMRHLFLTYELGVAGTFAKAARGNPRQLNDYIKAARALTSNNDISVELAREVITHLCSTTLDGLTASMQTVLRFLYLNCRRETRNGVSYVASVSRLATAAGHGRDTKAIALLVEPYLLQRGLLDVLPTGRALTPAGVERARQLTGA
jgi:holliday junction DNA helicase RuvB